MITLAVSNAHAPGPLALAAIAALIVVGGLCVLFAFRDRGGWP